MAADARKQQPDLIPVRLSWVDWLIVLPAFAGFLAVIPVLWDRAEKFEPGEDYRISAGLRDDYALFRRWARAAAAQYPALVIGDSTVWGRYTDRHRTWPAQLNKLLGKPAFGNLGVDGLHNVALVGLLRDYGGAVRGKHVLLQFNPLWMTSEERDLSQAKRADSINHPRLLPQFDRTLECYAAPFEERVAIWSEHTFPFSSLLNHIALCYFGSRGAARWMTEHPYRSPLSALRMSIPTDAACDGPEDDTTSDWAARNMGRQNWAWVPVERSRQWAAFREALRILTGRGNSAFVVIGPFNPHMLSAGSLARYRALLAEIARWLDVNQPDYFIVPALPSGEYGDSSHPLGPGYLRAAESLLGDARFRAWLTR